MLLTKMIANLQYILATIVYLLERRECQHPDYQTQNTVLPEILVCPKDNPVCCMVDNALFVQHNISHHYSACKLSFCRLFYSHFSSDSLPSGIGRFETRSIMHHYNGQRFMSRILRIFFFFFCYGFDRCSVTMFWVETYSFKKAVVYIFSIQNT